MSTVSTYSKVLSATSIQNHSLLYITIGPQCSGKTSYLSTIPNLLDIAIDNHPDVYYKVTVQDMLAANRFDTKSVDNAELFMTLVFGRLLGSRLQDAAAVEEGAVLAFLTNFIDVEALKSVLRISCSADELLVAKSVEQLIRLREEGVQFISPTADVYIREGHTCAIAATKTDLYAAAVNHSGPIAYGNTNLTSRALRTALVTALRSKRLVRLVCWGIELPRVPLSVLLERNFRRFCLTGRYIPLSVLSSCYSQAEAQLEHGAETLTASAGLRILADGRVQFLPQHQK